ncbi:DUF4145 domain-containing protein [Glaciimonas sp. CA11.2]|uniref:DUF4145 domain-containing protein n=1 Tax=Glaciimonas sp. CA11.2 TaxID=3048601 RepID=UPI002AB33345|nr:DUF4145 domain-containing protein [Glaciimonas sp. CA11.2]MDY7546737.1 DUF4145 domain-containing protein [Glaciimonas sp. CA11.2]MEB0162888.1 DUF4145 domain-containing protein [Glaciimonas sp. CA11.2]
MCLDLLVSKSEKKIMLREGINMLRNTKVIDDRLHEWSQQLHAFRNLAAHPEDIRISHNDAEFMKRVDARAKRKKS